MNAALRTAALAGTGIPTPVVRILGVDPGSRTTGWGVIELRGPDSSCIAFGRIRCEAGPLSQRLLRILNELSAVIVEHAPHEAAIEDVFVRTNVASALVLGHARGAAICALAGAALQPAEYAPARIKSAIVGNGRAEKAQVQHMVRALLKLGEEPPTDAADALAVALCHAHMRGAVSTARGVSRRGKSSWRDFVPTA